jgi:hypothetical protein
LYSRFKTVSADDVLFTLIGVNKELAINTLHSIYLDMQPKLFFLKKYGLSFFSGSIYRDGVRIFRIPATV